MPVQTVENHDGIELADTASTVDNNDNRMVLEPKFADYGSILHAGSDHHHHQQQYAGTTTSSSVAPASNTNNTNTPGGGQQHQHQHSGIYDLSTGHHQPYQQYPTAGLHHLHQHYQHHQQQPASGGPPHHLLTSPNNLVDAGGNPVQQQKQNGIMTQEDDMYQRKPLLPVASKGDLWGSPTSMPSYYGEEDEENVLQKSSDSNGIIKITMPAPVREEPRFPQERWKTLLAAIILFFNFVLVLTSLSLVHERVPDRSIYGPLPDVFHDAVPAQDWGLDVSEYLLIICFNSAIVAVLLHKHRFIVARRAFLIMSLLYMYRSITMYVTAMPVSSTTYYCSPKSNQTSPVEVVKRIVQLAAGMGLSINGKHTYCGDYIYSGHTVILVFSYLLISEYTPKKLYVIHWAYGLAALTGVVMLMIAHGHYTVDVLIAYYVTTRTFWMYHTLANNHILKQHSPNNLLGRAWWFRFFLYFEGNVGGTVPRQWPDWPFPRPRRLHAKSRES